MFKPIPLIAPVVCVAILCLDVAYGLDPKPALPAKAENADLLKGLTVTGTLKQCIGTFTSFGPPDVGDSFEINLDDLPKDKIELVPRKKGHSTYMPFQGSLAITKVEQAEAKPDMAGKVRPRPASIELRAVDRDNKFVIWIMAEDLSKGSKVHVYFYHPQDPFGSMAEAEGVLK